MKINTKDFVETQYKSAANLNTRISIHNKYSVNKQGFGNWIVENYDIEDGMRVLELGCGNGNVWKNHENLFAKCKEVFLTDFSEGMLSSARENLGELPGVTYRVADIQEIPFENHCFDMVIANMMLYHVPDLTKGLSEVRRVLKPGCRFYCATTGENTIMKFVTDKLKPYGVNYHVDNTFSLQNGTPKLSRYFSDIKTLLYEDSLEVTNLDDLLDYMFSGIHFQKACTLDRAAIKNILEKEMVNGVFKIPKEAGMFVCK